MSTPDAPPVPFRVLVVCTGNICRSPAVERLLVAGLGPDSGVEVSSAGTQAVVGRPISGPMVPLLTAAGGVANGFVARQLTEPLVREADVVLALTRPHRSAVVEVVPAAVRRTFTLRELARIAEGVAAELPDGTPAQRFAELVRLAVAQRGTWRAQDPADDDVVDPYGRGDALYSESFGVLRPAVDTVVRVVRG